MVLVAFAKDLCFMFYSSFSYTVKLKPNTENIYIYPDQTCAPSSKGILWPDIRISVSFLQ